MTLFFDNRPYLKVYGMWFPVYLTIDFIVLVFCCYKKAFKTVYSIIVELIPNLYDSRK